MNYWIVGPLNGTPYTRYATANGIQISRPEGKLIDPPAGWMSRQPRKKTDSDIRYVNFQMFTGITGHNGQQPRKPVWRRASKRVEGGLT